MFIETFGALAGFYRAMKENFQLQRELKEHRNLQDSGCFTNTIRKV